MGVNKHSLINRDLSWLSFNARVLQEAGDPTVPLLERIRFLGIYSNNRDEFFRVRVATIRRMDKFGKKAKIILGADPTKLLEHIQDMVLEQQTIFENLYANIISELRKEKIFIVDEKKLNKTQQEFVREYFDRSVAPFLIPIMIDSAPKFPYLRDRMIYLAIKILSEKKGKKNRMALIEVPTDVLPRFVVLPSDPNTNVIILLEDIIRFSLNKIFLTFDYNSIESYAIKITRDSELDIDTDISKSFMEKISKSVKLRNKGVVVRFEYDMSMPDHLLRFILRKIKLKASESLIPGSRYHNFRDFINFPTLGRNDLWYKKLVPAVHPDFKNQKSLLNVIKKKDVLLAYPYTTFNHIIDLLREAAIDPKVISIRITLYRVANNSNIINALINAVRNGKKVLAVVELQARFDEESNIYYANKLQEEGAEVIFGVQGLKVHSKMFLITRQEEHKIVQYAHIGTGNFNENTAMTYCDHSLLTSDKRITNEVEMLFGFYQNNYKTGYYKHLVVSPFNTRKQFTKLIEHEIMNAKAGKEAWMILKMNSLVDNDMIELLYTASKAGVKIRMIVRGICSLVPGIPDKSENIEVISIVDRFLEHSRIFIFCNSGDNKYYISSGDWMYRNLDHRSEVATPVYDPAAQKQLMQYVVIQLNDNRKARVINQSGANNFYVINSKKAVRSQDEIFRYYSQTGHSTRSKIEYSIHSNGHLKITKVKTS